MRAPRSDRAAGPAGSRTDNAPDSTDEANDSAGCLPLAEVAPYLDMWLALTAWPREREPDARDRAIADAIDAAIR